MALTASTIWECRASATTGNTNGGGFNTANANFVTDLTATSGTGNSPVVSSATYTFVAGDVGAQLYVKTGTNWTPGWYPIASVSAGAATLSAAIGQAVQVSTTTAAYGANTVAGVATTASPTGGTFGIDYSQQDTAQATATDYTAVGASSTLTSASAGFTRMMVGNIFHQTTTGTAAHGVVGWYEIVSFTNTTTVVLDRTPNDATTSVACTGFVGGAGRLNGLEDAWFEAFPAGSRLWIKNGAYTISANINVASAAATTTDPIVVMGYNTQRGDTCNLANRPVLTFAASTATMAAAWEWYNLTASSTTAAGFSIGTSSSAVNCKFTNTSTTTTRAALTMTTGCTAFNCEAVSQNGIAITTATQILRASGCYVHDSVTGLSTTTGSLMVIENIVECCSTDSITSAAIAGASFIIGNTIYGREAKIGNGVSMSSASSLCVKMWNNIFYGLATAVNITTTKQGTNTGQINNYFNNTTNATNYDIGLNNLAVDPTFTGATQITGTTATTSGSVLTQAGGDFSTVTDNVDYLRVISGTGVTVGGYLITSHTSTTLTVNNALGTSSGGDVVYFVSTGHNFQIGTNLKGLGFPGFANAGAETTSYPDVGAVQRQEASGGASAYTFS